MKLAAVNIAAIQPQRSSQGLLPPALLLMGYSPGARTNPARRLFGATEMD
jgi:hypothetical protein